MAYWFGSGNGSSFGAKLLPHPTPGQARGPHSPSTPPPIPTQGHGHSHFLQRFVFSKTGIRQIQATLNTPHLWFLLDTPQLTHSFSTDDFACDLCRLEW